MTAILRSRQIRDADHLMILAIVGISVFGMMTLKSIPGADVRRQTILFAAGIICFFAAAYIDYGFLRHAWQAMYWATLAILVIVLLLGETIGGGKSWLLIGPFQFQPSEFAKVVMIACLAVYCADIGPRIGDGLEFTFCLVAMALPMWMLVVAQRDLGTTLVMVAIWAGIMYFSGANIWHMAIFAVVSLAVAKLMIDVGKIPPYMLARVQAWMHPTDFLVIDDDPLQTGRQYLQAWRAVGSGGVWGLGYGQGLLTQSGRVSAQSTDMTFSALAEELGFAGCVTLIALYGIVIWRGLTTIAKTQHDLGRYIAAGVVSYLAFEVIVNIGMNVGLLPITGIPLPLFSRGGSNLIATMVALGLLVNVHLRRRLITFEAAA